MNDKLLRRKQGVQQCKCTLEVWGAGPEKGKAIVVGVGPSWRAPAGWDAGGTGVAGMHSHFVGLESRQRSARQGKKPSRKAWVALCVPQMEPSSRKKTLPSRGVTASGDGRHLQAWRRPGGPAHLFVQLLSGSGSSSGPHQSAGHPFSLRKKKELSIWLKARVWCATFAHSIPKFEPRLAWL